jgi:PIN domain nuclease of toxin-antitoxin system
MNYLLDTHTLIWYLENTPDLSAKAIHVIRDQSNMIHVSSINFWEIAIKLNSGKLDIGFTLNQIINETQKLGFQLVRIENSHILKLESLVFHHKDPFDRLLIAQSQVEKLILISKDEIIPLYDVEVLW